MNTRIVVSYFFLFSLIGIGFALPLNQSILNISEKENTHQIHEFTQLNSIGQASSIVIDGDLDFHSQAVINGWDGNGAYNGTANFPYIISNLTFKSAWPAIDIRNTNVHFKVINCTLSDMNIIVSSYGILLENVANAVFDNMTVINRKYLGSIQFRLCSDIVLNNSVIINSNGYLLVYFSSNIQVLNNIFKNYTYGVYFFYSWNNRLVNNNFTNCGFSTTGYSQNEVSGNYVNERPLVYLQDQVGTPIPSDCGEVVLVNCSHMEIKDFTFISNTYGLVLAECEYIYVHDISFFNNSRSGMEIYFSNSIILDRNKFTNCDYGIKIEGYISNSIGVNYTVTNNIINPGITSDHGTHLYKGNYVYGITIYRITNITFSNNTIMDYHNGLDCRSSNNVIISGNNINRCVLGVTITGGDTKIILNNITRSLNVGIILYSVNNSLVTDNLIEYIGGFTSTAIYGIYINTCENSKITRNDIIGNNRINKSLSEGYASNCHNVNFSLNFWSDWAKPNENGDGIVDLPYLLDGDSQLMDQTPVTIPYFFIHSIDPKSLAILTPRGGKFSQVIVIEWTPLIDSVDHSINYHLYYSDDNGSSWHYIHTITDNTTYTWNVSQLADGSEYRIKIIGYCNEVPAFNVTAISDKSFTIENSISISFSSFPEITPSYSIIQVILVLFILVSFIKKKK